MNLIQFGRFFHIFKKSARFVSNFRKFPQNLPYFDCLHEICYHLVAFSVFSRNPLILDRFHEICLIWMFFSKFRKISLFSTDFMNLAQLDRFFYVFTKSAAFLLILLISTTDRPFWPIYMEFAFCKVGFLTYFERPLRNLPPIKSAQEFA